jgi:hypothetical protein
VSFRDAGFPLTFWVATEVSQPIPMTDHHGPGVCVRSLFGLGEHSVRPPNATPKQGKVVARDERVADHGWNWHLRPINSESPRVRHDGPSASTPLKTWGLASRSREMTADGIPVSGSEEPGELMKRHESQPRALPEICGVRRNSQCDQRPDHGGRSTGSGRIEHIVEDAEGWRFVGPQCRERATRLR